VASANEFTHYAEAARRARGELLFFTEAHVIPEPDTLAEAVRFLDDRPELAGAFCRGEDICPTTLERMQQGRSLQWMEGWQTDAHWCKFHHRGVLLRRSAYEAVGGLSDQYHHFATWVMSFRLHAAGYRLGYASRSVVHHHNAPTLSTMMEPVEDFTWGEFCYRRDHPDDGHEAYFGLPREWAERGDRNPAAQRAVCRAVARVLLTPSARRRCGALLPHLRGALYRRWPALLGRDGLLDRATLRYWAACGRFALWRWHERRLTAACQDLYQRMVERTRLRFLAEHFRDWDGGLRAPGTWSMGEVPAEDLTGFQALERYQGRPFRWTDAVCAFACRAEAGSWVVTLETGGLRTDPDASSLVIAVNGRIVPAADVRTGADRVEFRFTSPPTLAGAPQWVVLMSPPLQPWKHGVADQRDLGVPIFSVGLAPAAAAAGLSRRAA
jgi:hypothetical protein